MADKEVRMIFGGPWGWDKVLQNTRRRRYEHGRCKKGGRQRRALSCRMPQPRCDRSHPTGFLGDCMSLRNLTFRDIELKNTPLLLGQSNVKTSGILAWYRRQLLSLVE